MSMAYVAIDTCGCTVMATVDNPEHAKENAKEIAACLRDGLRIEHVTAEWVRTESRWGCDVCRPSVKTPRPVQEALPL